jgi:hypothetical protein
MLVVILERRKMCTKMYVFVQVAIFLEDEKSAEMLSKAIAKKLTHVVLKKSEESNPPPAETPTCLCVPNRTLGQDLTCDDTCIETGAHHLACSFHFFLCTLPHLTRAQI